MNHPAAELRGINATESPLPSPPHQVEGILQGSRSKLLSIDKNYDE